MGWTDPAAPSGEPEPPSSKPGCGAKLLAAVVLLGSVAVIAGAGTFVPLGIDESAATLLALWAVKTLFGVNLAPFLRTDRAPRTQASERTLPPSADKRT